jgi:hypothetical protein
VQDRDAAKPLLETVRGRLPRLEIIWADGAYKGIVIWVQEHCAMGSASELRYDFLFLS